ncbi:MAG: hypothetical protein ABIC04_02525 [Nanoarchaeota archaeon]
MDDERAKPLFNKESAIPKKFGWEELKYKDGAGFEAHYIDILRELGKGEGIIEVIFWKSA